MNLKFDSKKFLLSFVVAFIANVVVVNLWNLFFHGQVTFNLGFSFVVALVMGVALGIIDTQ